jgi:site-specific DNA-methyltransferase (adenine-specific)
MSIQITNEDNLQFMARYPDKHFDLAVIDPPYGINAPKMAMGTNKSKTGKGQYPGESTADKIRKGRLNGGSGKLKNRALNTMNCDWDVPPAPEFWNEIFRVSKNQVIFGYNYFSLPPTRGIAFWDKLQPWTNFSQFELIWTSFDVPAKKFELSNTGGRNEERKIHPTQKPVQLYKDILSWYADKGWSILDTGFGSGSIVIACIDMGLDFYGCEKNPLFFESAKKRIEEYQQQKELFSSCDMIRLNGKSLFDGVDE